MSKISIPRSSSSKYGLLDWADNHLILKCPSREDSLEFTERRGGGGEVDDADGGRERTSTGCGKRPFVTGDNEDHQSHRSPQNLRFNAVKSKVLGLLVLLAVICALLTGVAITGRRIDLSSISKALKLSGAPSEEVVVVETNCGRVIGTVNEGAFVFKVRSKVHFHLPNLFSKP